MIHVILHSQNSRAGWAREHVEMAGVEPASEEKTIRSTTCVVSLSNFIPPAPTDRRLAGPPQVTRLRRDLRVAPGGVATLACLKSAPLRKPAGRFPGDGSLKV